MEIIPLLYRGEGRNLRNPAQIKTNQQHDCRLPGPSCSFCELTLSESLMSDIKKTNTKDAAVAAFEREHLFGMNNGWEQSFQADYLSLMVFFTLLAHGRRESVHSRESEQHRLQQHAVFWQKAAASRQSCVSWGESCSRRRYRSLKTLWDACLCACVCVRAHTFAGFVHPQLWISVDRCRAPRESSAFELEKILRSEVMLVPRRPHLIWLHLSICVINWKTCEAPPRTELFI